MGDNKNWGEEGKGGKGRGVDRKGVNFRGREDSTEDSKTGEGKKR